jgi:Fibronectin type III domain
VPQTRAYEVTVGGGAVPEPGAPTSVTAVKGTDPQTQVDVEWSPPAGGGPVEGYRVYLNGAQHSGDLGSGAFAYTASGLTAGSTYTVVVRAFNATGASAASSPANVTLDAPVVSMLMGCSASPNDHGGSEEWEGWRIYTRSALYSYANRTGSLRPEFVAYSVDGGANIGGSSPVYSTLYEYVRDELDAFYYTGSAANHTGGTPSGRWGIKLFWSNGNENSHKGVLSTHNATNFALYAESMRALYDGCHFIDPGTGQRRYPDAYAGSNPTQDHERAGEVEAWLHPSARYHDFVMWSMYPPGRQSTVGDPTYNFPSFNEANRNDRQLGFLLRCFYRTYQAQQFARTALGDPNFSIQIGTGEIGIADDPDDQTTRPWYIAYGLAGAMRILQAQYGLTQPFACWWDNELGAGPQNILSDEPAGTNPSSRVTWQNWEDYDRRVGGTSPAAWSHQPHATLKYTGTPVSPV